MCLCMYLLDALCCSFLLNVLIYIRLSTMKPGLSFPLLIFAKPQWLTSQKSRQCGILQRASHQILFLTLQIKSLSKANVSISLCPLSVPPVNKEVASNPIIQTTNRQEQRQQFSLQPFRKRSQDRRIGFSAKELCSHSANG